jgi:hypothetical protein
VKSFFLCLDGFVERFLQHFISQGRDHRTNGSKA